MFTILEIRKLSNILTIILAVSLTLSFKADASENSPLKIGDQVFVSTIKKVGTLIEISKGSGKVSLQTADGLEYKLFNLGKLYKNKLPRNRQQLLLLSSRQTDNCHQLAKSDLSYFRQFRD